MNCNKIACGFLSAFSLVMTLTACQNETDLTSTAGNYISVPVSTIITVPEGDETRTTLNENAGDLQWKWEEGDQVIAIDMLTGTRGFLTAGEPINDGKTAPFSGNINFEAGATTAKLAIFYLGKNVDPASLKNTLTIDLNNQDGEFSSLVNRDVLATGTSTESAVEVTINPTYTVIKDFELKHMTSAGHFQLKIKDGETINNAVVTISGTESGQIVTPVSYTIGKADTFAEDASEYGIINTTTSSNGDFYITMFPSSKMAMKFVTTYNDKEYTGYLGGSEDFSFSLSAGQYLRSSSNNYGPLVIEMETDEPEETIDHTLNPLLKWAEGNLVYNSTTGTSNISGDPYEGGSLYQWGRNHGFDDYADALGTWSSSNYAYSYGTYGQSYCAGDGFETPSGNTGYSKSSQRYTKEEQLISNGAKAMFLIGSKDMTSGDYWQFDDNSTDWDSRAENCGYNKLAPNGYRLPTTNDFTLIFPKNSINTTAFGLSSEMSDLSELRKLETGEQYVIKWTLSTVSNKRVMIIKTLMVSDSFTESMLSSVDWTSSDVVTRYFPATGAIEAYYHQYVNSQYNTLEVLRPMPFGTWEAVLQTYPNSYNAKYWSVKITNIQDAGKTYEGAYWCSDKKMIFRFRDNQGKFGSDNTTSLLGPSYQPAQNGFAIRCINTTVENNQKAAANK